MPVPGVTSLAAPIVADSYSSLDHPDPRVRDRSMSLLASVRDRAHLAWALARQRPRPPGYGESEWAAFLFRLPADRLLARASWSPVNRWSMSSDGLPSVIMEDLMPLFYEEVEALLQAEMRRVLAQFIGGNMADFRSKLTSLTVQTLNGLADVLGADVRANAVSVVDDPGHPRGLICQIDVLVGGHGVVLEVRWC